MAPSANHIAFTSPINPAGAIPLLSRRQVWAGLLLKIRSAEIFVPKAIQATSVISESVDPKSGNPVTVREVVFRENQRKVQETVTAFADSRVDFVQPDGSMVSNIVSDGANGELYMTYTFEWRHPNASEEELLAAREKEGKLGRIAVEETLVAMRKLVEEGEI